MSRYLHKKRTGLLAGLASIIVLAALASSAGATPVCPPGVKPPSRYCTSVPPIASTVPATNQSPTGATLNGVAGPALTNGDTTSYEFQYGATTGYGKTTPVATTPSGLAAAFVSATATGLTPGTTYHFRIVASNADGTTAGSDATFRTAPPPIQFVHAPSRVRHNSTFKVTVKLRSAAKLTIALLRGRRTIKKFNEGTVSGTVTQLITAPRKTGKYTLRVTASVPGYTQTVTSPLRVF